MLNQILKRVVVDPEVDAAFAAIPNKVNELGYDAWGFNPEQAKILFSLGKRIFEYFHPEITGIEHLPAGRVLVVPNHAGQLPFDGVVVAQAMLLRGQPPRMARAMAERFFPTVPIVNEAFSRAGVVVGDPVNCKNLLLDDQAILVFPEGARGSGKVFQDRYKLVRFGRGFMRLALQTHSPVVPVSVVGSEESIISIYDWKGLAKLLGAPYIPISPLLPLLGPLAYFPLPTRFYVDFGEPIWFDGPFDDEDAEIDKKVDVVQDKVQSMINARLANRTLFLGAYVGTILVTGIAGGLSQRVAKDLRERGHEVVGVDYRAVSAGAAVEGGPLSGMPIYQANYNKTRIEDVFRRHKLDGVFHLGRVGNLKESAGKRFDLNVVGSQKIMNLCLEKKVASVLVLSTFHIYGAHPANHTPIYEDEPLRAGLDFPQIADAIQLDNMASTWVWKHADVNVAVLRPTNVIGPTIRNTMSNLLRQPRVPYLFGFNPMSQFVHEDDLSRAIIDVYERKVRGVFNVAGPGVMPYRTALELVGAKGFPLPYSLASAYLRAFPSIPHYLLNFLRYPCVIADTALREASGWEPRVSMQETLRSTVREAHTS